MILSVFLEQSDAQGIRASINKIRTVNRIVTDQAQTENRSHHFGIQNTYYLTFWILVSDVVEYDVASSIFGTFSPKDARNEVS